jgi:hypothetical protein
MTARSTFAAKSLTILSVMVANNAAGSVVALPPAAIETVDAVVGATATDRLVGKVPHAT